ncbi:MAG: DUF1552 domain-containing protein [Myxococcota bacterium]
MSSNTTSGLSRRTLLKGLGAASLSAPFLRSFQAQAQTGPKPKLVFFASPSGYLVGPNGGNGFDGWLPQPLRNGNGYAEMALNAGTTLPEVIETLDEHKAHLVAMDGISAPNGVGGHQATAGILTGRGVFNNERQRAAGGDGEWYSEGISVDQFIANELDTRVLGLSFRIQGFQLGEGYISHLGANRGFTPIQDPVEAFDRVFAGGTGTNQDAVARIARQQRVLDLLRQEASSLERRLPIADRERLQRHLESINGIEADLMPPQDCGSTMRPGSYDARNTNNIPRLIRDYNRIMVQAMACGYNQVGFVQLGNLEGGLVPNWAEFDLSTTFRDHAIAHKFGGMSGAGSDGLSQNQARQLAIKCQKAYNALFADLITRLRDTPDVDGSPMLDHTIVVHIRPMGRNHENRRMLWIAAGGSALGVNTGRFLRLTDTKVNDLHVTLCNKMGLTEVTTFGRNNENNGPVNLD